MPLATIPFNGNLLKQILNVDFLSGRSLTISFISLLVVIAGLTISRLIYSDKNTQEIIQISMANYMLNMVYLTIFLLGSTYIAFEAGLEVTSDTGAFIAVVMLSLLINTVFIENYLGEHKSKSNLSLKEIWDKFTRRSLIPVTLIYTFLIAILAAVAILAPSITIALVWTISFLLWQILYIYFIQPTLLPEIL